MSKTNEEQVDQVEEVAAKEEATEPKIKQLEKVGDYVKDGENIYLVASTKKEADKLFKELKETASGMGMSDEEVEKSVSNVTPVSKRTLKSQYNIEISREISEEEKQAELQEMYQEQAKLMKKLERRRLIENGQTYLKGGFRLIKNFTAKDRKKRKVRNRMQKASRIANRT